MTPRWGHFQQMYFSKRDCHYYQSLTYWSTLKNLEVNSQFKAEKLHRVRKAKMGTPAYAPQEDTPQPAITSGKITGN